MTPSLSLPGRPELNSQVAIWAGELLIKPLSAAVLMKDVAALRHDFHSIAIGKRLKTYRTFPEFLEELLVAHS